MFYLFLLGKALTLIFPRCICYFIAKVLAIVHFYLSKGDREAVTYNLLPVVEGKVKLRKCAKEVFVNFSYYLVDFFRSSKLNKDFIKKYVKISGLDYLKQALSRGKGIIILSAHIGNYELGAAIASLLDYPIYVIALPHKDKRTNRFFDNQRQMTRIKIIPTGIAVKGCFSALRGGKLVGFLGDREFGRGGLKVKMFSKHVLLPKGAAFFALKTGAFIIPTFCIREDKNFYHLVFEKPIVPQEGNFKNEEDLVREYIPVLEKYIKKYPEQWYMFEKCWI